MSSSALRAPQGADDDPDDDLHEDPDDDPDEVIRTGTAAVTDEAAELDVDDQIGDSTSVQLDQVRPGAAAGFVVVVDASRNVLGWVGAPPGVQPTSLTLTTPLRFSQELVAMLFRDDGDGYFDPASDAIVVADNEPVAEDFDYVIRTTP